MSQSKKVLVTGGVGYIGSHTCIELAGAGYELVVYDNLSNSNLEALRRVEKIIGKSIEFIKGDVLDIELLQKVFGTRDFFGVIHFAGLKAVGESVEKPLLYYQNNVAGTLDLLEVMKQHNVKNFVFSSSATVYKESKIQPLKEDFPKGASSPYGQSKLMVEYILEDLASSDPNWNIVSLRYFNPVGAHQSGLIGEDPNDIPNNLMPYISQVAVGKLKQLSIFGNDYDTIDGTGVRDYIHVVDLARGHVSALDYITKQTKGLGFLPLNLGNNRGVSVLQLVHAFIENTKQDIPYVFTDRRAGDIGCFYANADRAKELLGWQAELGIGDMCRDTWKWQSSNPGGY